MRLSGEVVSKLVSPGSKSERKAVVLRSQGEDYVLRRRGGNPFVDDALTALVGQKVELDGILHGYTFIVDLDNDAV